LNDEFHWVGHDRTKTIDHDETARPQRDGGQQSIESLSKFADKYKNLYARRREAAKRVRENHKQKACCD
jgi:hypothetical protein